MTSIQSMAYYSLCLYTSLSLLCYFPKAVLHFFPPFVKDIFPGEYTWVYTWLHGIHATCVILTTIFLLMGI